MGSELSVLAEEEKETSDSEREEPRPAQEQNSDKSEQSKHSVLFLTEEEAKQPSKVIKHFLSHRTSSLFSGHFRGEGRPTSRSDPAQWRHQLELSVSGWDGSGSLWYRV